MAKGSLEKSSPGKYPDEQLEILFEFVAPQELKKHITFLLMQFLIRTPPDKVPENAREVYESVYFLMDFLDGVGEGKRMDV